MKKMMMAMVLLTLSAFSTLTMAAGEVGLLKASSVISYYRGYWHVGRFEAQVANLGYSKAVSAYIKTTDGSWVDMPMNFVRTVNASKEVWAADFNGLSLPATGDIIEFAIKYQVNGITYWDNNNWANYKLPQGGGTLLGNNVNVYVANYAADIPLYQTSTSWGSNITVRNLAYTKSVKVIYSTDNWATSKTAVATYSPIFWSSSYAQIANPNAMGFEEWNFQLDIGSASQVEYAISYTVNGQTYWDNNFGRNYYTHFTRM